MARTRILIGGNLGDRERIQEEVLLVLEEEAGRIVARSSLYRSTPWGFAHSRDFLNRVLVLETERAPLDLLERLLRIEERFGRERRDERSYQGRYLDLDILYYEDRIIQEPSLKVPHPRIPERRFTLAPLDELEPGFLDPLREMTVKEMLEQCSDPLEVKVHDPTCVTNT